MKFIFREGLIWIPIEIVYEGHTVTIENCIVDTGSATTAIDIDLIAFNYRKPAFIRRLRGLGGGTQEVVCQQIEGLKIDMTCFSDIGIEFGDIASQFGINGFIGNDVLRHCVLTIDFSQRNLRVCQIAPENSNYTQERDELFRDLTLGDILTEIRQQQMQ